MTFYLLDLFLFVYVTSEPIFLYDKKVSLLDSRNQRRNTRSTNFDSGQYV